MNESTLTVLFLVLLTFLFLFLASLVVILLILLKQSWTLPSWILKDQLTENQLLRNQLRTTSLSDLNGMNAATLPLRSVSNLTPDDTPVGNDSESIVDFINVDDLSEEDIQAVASTNDLEMMGWAEPVIKRNPDGTYDIQEPGL